MAGSIRIRFLRSHIPHSQAEQTDRLFPRAVKALGRPEVKDGYKISEVVGEAIETVAQIQVSSPCKLGSKGSTDVAVEEAFDWGLDVLREVQYRYRQVTETVAALVTRENIPPVVIMNRVVHNLDGSVLEDPGMGGFFTGAVSFPEIETEDLTKDQKRSLVSKPWNRPDDGLFQRFNTFSADASEAFLLSGDYRATVLNSAIASECLLDDILCYMLWWERLAPQSAAVTLVKPIYKKVRTEYAHRIGGVWSPERKGAIADWHRCVARIRDRIIHGGYHPTRKEANDALAAVKGLRTLLGRLVTTQKVRRSYPHLPLLLLGGPGMSEAGLDPAPVMDWYESSADFGGRLNNWRAISKRLRVEHFSSTGSIEPEFDQCTVIAIVDKSQIRHFATDPSFALVSEISIPGMNSAELKRLWDIQEEMKDGEWAILSLVEFGTPDRARKSTKWLPMEEIVPGFEFEVPQI